MALSIGFRIISFLPSCYSSYGVLDSYPGGTLTHCSCQPSLDAHFTVLILPGEPEPNGSWGGRHAELFACEQTPCGTKCAGTRDHNGALALILSGCAQHRFKSVPDGAAVPSSCVPDLMAYHTQ